MINPITKYKFRRLPHRKTYEKCKHENVFTGYPLHAMEDFFNASQVYHADAICKDCNKEVFSKVSVPHHIYSDLMERPAELSKYITYYLYKNMQEA